MSEHHDLGFIFPRLRFHQRLREDVFRLLETGAARQAVKHHEGNQPAAGSAADHAVRADGAELVRNQKLRKHLDTQTNVPARSGEQARTRAAAAGYAHRPVIFPHCDTLVRSYTLSGVELSSARGGGAAYRR